jgi:hypothetical protein
MNKQEEIMSNALPSNTLIAHAKALELFDEVRAMPWRLLNPKG